MGPGCSSGEEVYSLAIIIHECIELSNSHVNVQIFGTDIDERAIIFARTGKYPKSISVDISEERLNKYFYREDGYFKVKPKIREMVVFAPHNLIKNPPFIKLDLISCRNLLIYFDSVLQKKLFPTFNYSLNPGGLLFLGSSETIGQNQELFSILEKKWKIFRKSPSKILKTPLFSYPYQGIREGYTHRKEADMVEPPKDVNLIRLLKTLLIQSDLSTCIVINQFFNIIYIHGRTGQFLEPPEGEVSINILDMARPFLKKRYRVHCISWKMD
ncbi:MAG: hypothetical protein JEY91_17045 [Spirochaetaceae bacterium]|nr:hypothetical protein [Spirochaetaceae bacterium]